MIKRPQSRAYFLVDGNAQVKDIAGAIQGLSSLEAMEAGAATAFIFCGVLPGVGMLRVLCQGGGDDD